MADRWDALTREEAREWALRYLRTELAGGRSPERLLKTSGYRGGPAEPGVHFEGGRMVIAGRFPAGKMRISSTRELLGHHFLVADLLLEVAAGQLSLFGGAPCAAS